MASGGSKADSGAGPTEGGGSGEGGSGATNGGSGASGGEDTAGGEGGGGPGLGTTFEPYPTVRFPEENPFTAEKALLGKILFWEEQMGSDNTMACGTCHRAGSGGSDPRGASPESRHPGATASADDDIHGSLGVKRCTDAGGTITYKDDPVFGAARQVTRRRAPSYLDAMFAPQLFWDGRAADAFRDPDTNQIAIATGGALESQSVGPPLNDGEMACETRTWADIHDKLEAATPLALARDIPADMKAFIADNPTYPDLFEAAFGTPEISTRRIAFAIATHERRLTSNETPWDRYNAGNANALTPAERRGFELFIDKARCNLCHTPPLFTNNQFHNVGFIAADFDTGRQAVSGQTGDKGRVKTPTLRNVGLREPGGILHYGFGPGATLDAVMQAYNVAADAGNMDPLMLPLNLTDDEIADILVFMRDALTDPRVAAELPPFDRPKLGSEP